MNELKIISGADLMNTPIPPRPQRGGGPVRYVDQKVKVRGEKLSKIWWSGRQWAVTSYGLEALDGTYPIEKGRFFEDLPAYSWAQHMGAKNWVDNDDFVTAWLIAISLHGPLGKQLRDAVSRAHP